MALSADGTIAAVGAGYDQNLVGGVWLFSVTASGWAQDGPELTGQGETPATDAFGSSLALSADGSTLLVGGTGAPPGSAPIGAAYVFTRSDSTWSQQGAPLMPTDEAGSGAFGTSVALSADGNTAVIGGDGDNADVGAAWVFARSGSAWAQAGAKLLATGETGADGFGSSVALSADGSTALIGATANLANEGAWTFTLSAPTTGGSTTGPTAEAVPIHPFLQQGPKLTAGDESGAGGLGASVSLSADGNTALVGAPADNGQVGAAWVFVRSGSTWTQQGSKLTAAGETGAGQFGVSVSLSGDGNTGVIGAQADGATGDGAAWVYSRTGQTWAQTAKLVPTGETPASGSIPGGAFGASVALSANGSTAIVGAPSEAGRGAAWIFVRNGSAWSQQGYKLFGLSLSSGGALNPDSFGESVALSADGNTALVGAPTDGYFNLHPFPNAGAFFVFTRTGTSWSQQANEYSVHYTSLGLGTAVALSSDGNTALVTAPGTQVIGADGSVHEGAAWVFSRTANVWGHLGLIILPMTRTARRSAQAPQCRQTEHGCSSAARATPGRQVPCGSSTAPDSAGCNRGRSSRAAARSATAALAARQRFQRTGARRFSAAPSTMAPSERPGRSRRRSLRVRPPMSWPRPPTGRQP